MKINDIETPAMIVDLETMTQNMEVMDSFLIGNPKVKLRPHFKTSKTTEIAKMQMQRGAVGICAAKLSEAEVLVEAGIPNVLIANEVIQRSKIERMVELAKKTHLIVCVDNKENIMEISELAEKAKAEVFLYIEYDIEMHRCGVSNYEDFYRLANLIDSLPGITFSGIQAYAGHMSHISDLDYVKDKVDEYEKILVGLKEYLQDRGIAVKDISGASTNTARYKAGHGVYTELQPGSYIFLDKAYEPCNLPYKNSLYLLATVISKSSDRIILDVGTKGLGMDQVLPECIGFENKEYVFSEEHLAIQEGSKANIGDKVKIIPGHCCTTINLYKKLYVVVGEEVINIWDIDGSLKSV